MVRPVGVMGLPRPYQTPVEELYLPGGRGRQAASAAVLAATKAAYCPGGHGVPVQCMSPASEYVPAAHGVQVACDDDWEPVGPK